MGEMGKAEHGLEIGVAGVDQDGDGAIVEQLDFHVGGEDACLHRARELGTQLLYKAFVEGDRDGGRSGADVGGSVAFFGLGVEGELGDDEEGSTDVLDGLVHFAFFVIKNAELDEFLDGPLEVLLGVVVGDAEQDEEAMADGPYDLVVDGDLGLGDSLDDDTHSEV